MRRRVAVAFAISLCISMLPGCAPAQTAPSPATASSVAPSASPSPTREPLPPGALRFAVDTTRSLATVRVNEVIAAVRVPGEAVVRTSAFSGSLILMADGSFAGGSLVAADLDALRSDNNLRDEWIKFNTLRTSVYPRAEFTPSRVVGVTLPLPATGAWSATIEGTMKIHGVERQIAWPVDVTRSAGEVRVHGTTRFKFGDYGMDVPANRLILSVVDDVRLEIDVIARDG